MRLYRDKGDIRFKNITLLGRRLRQYVSYIYYGLFGIGTLTWETWGLILHTCRCLVVGSDIITEAIVLPRKNEEVRLWGGIVMMRGQVSKWGCGGKGTCGKTGWTGGAVIIRIGFWAALPGHAVTFGQRFCLSSSTLRLWSSHWLRGTFPWRSTTSTATGSRTTGTATTASRTSSNATTNTATRPGHGHPCCANTTTTPRGGRQAYAIHLLILILYVQLRTPQIASTLK